MAENIIQMIVGGFLSIIILITFVSTLQDITGDQKRTEIQQITQQKDQEIQKISQEKETYEEQANFYKNKYESLVNTSITKEDVTEIQGDLKVMQVQMQNLQNGTEIINNNINNFYDIKNTYFNLIISIMINFVAVIFFIFDWTFMSFTITKAVIGRLEDWLDDFKEWIKRIFRRDNHE